MRFFALLISFTLLCSSSQAAVLLTIGNISVAQDSGIHTIDVQISSDAGDSLLGISADFQLTAGIFTDPPGTFGAAGFVGAGNYEPTSGFIRDGGDSSLSLFSGEFTNTQPIPGTDSLFLQLSIDVNGVTPGTYGISAFNMFAFNELGDDVTISAIDGSFTVNGISGVPEPSSTALLSLLVAAGVGRYRFGRRKHVAESEPSSAV